MTVATDLQTLETMAQLPDDAASKSSILAIAAAGSPPLDSTAWVLGDPAERFVEIAARAMDAWGPVTTAAARGLFLSLQTDPGDPGDLSVDQTPRAGWLSALGVGWFGTVRGGATYATGVVRVTNSGTTTATFKAYDLTFERSTIAADGGHPTYKNTEDASVYVNADASITLTPGAHADIPVIAEQVGTYADAPAGTLSIVVTQSFGTLTCSNASPAYGRDREGKDDYIARCILASAKASPGGPQQAYLYAMNTAIDGEPLQRHDGTGPVGITRAHVSTDSAYGVVLAYFADADGAADAVDVASANANVTGVALGVIIDPIGVVPDATTYTGAAAIPTTIAVTYSARIKASAVDGGATPGVYTSGGGPPDPIADVFASVAAALGAFLAAFPIGGVEQVSGAGVLYTSDLQDTVRDALAGLYGPAVALPATATTALALGHVPTLGAVTGTLTVVP